MKDTCCITSPGEILTGTSSPDGRLKKWLHPSTAWWAAECTRAARETRVRSSLQEHGWLEGSIMEKPTPAWTMTHERCTSAQLADNYIQPVPSSSSGIVNYR